MDIFTSTNLIVPLLKLNRNDHPLKVDDLPEALCYLIDRGANGMSCTQEESRPDHYDDVMMMKK